MIHGQTVIRIRNIPGAAEARAALIKLSEVLAETNSGLHLARHKLLAQ